MLTLHQDDVLLACHASDWRDALDQAAASLADYRHIGLGQRVVPNQGIIRFGKRQ